MNLNNTSKSSCAPQATPPNVQFDTQLIKRHDLAGPRYTSYPTALQFSESLNGHSFIEQAKKSVDQAQPLSLYFHIPFCAHVCYYCACNKVITNNRARSIPYLATLYKEMAFMAAHFSNNRVVEQLHLGGGTPTFLSHHQLIELMTKTRELFNLRDDDLGDYSIEIDPRECTSDTLKVLRKTGFNRLSLGVQDVNKSVQIAVNRVQSTAWTADLITQARELGFKSINIDLIYGLAHQTKDSFLQTLEQVVAMSPDRLSVFNYAHMPDRFRPQRHIKAEDLPSPAQKLSIQQATIDYLVRAGYVYIGMDHFAKPEDTLALAQHNGQLHRNFQGYTTHADCDLVAMGVSSISQIGNSYYQNSHDLTTYTQLIEERQCAVIKGVSLSEDDKIRRALISQLICHFQLDIKRFNQEQQIEFNQYFSPEIAQLQLLAADNLISLDNQLLSVSSTGRLLIRRICMVFDKYLKKPHKIIASSNMASNRISGTKPANFSRII
ncbi:oxygen-independent coproporphyrinogen III oxidase [Gammaproteobacteria bacterium AS21]